MNRRALSLFALLIIFTPSRVADAATLTCTSTSTTLEELGACIVAAIPRAGQGWVRPDAAALDDFRAVAGAMLEGRCDDVELSASLAGAYSIGSFDDASNGKRYCVLMEVEDANDNGRVDRAWGTFITNPGGRRELHIHISHPLADAVTEVQGIAVFKAVDARSFLLSGTHRNASAVLAACQGEPEADVAHNASTPYHAAVEALAAAQQGNLRDWTTIQFHGMANSTCPGTDAYMTYGLAAPDGIPAPGDRVLDLRSALLADHADWTLTVPGDVPTCTLNATTNVQGRLLNGVPAADVCGSLGSTYGETFIHIEQKRCKGGTTTTCAATGPDAIRYAGNWVDSLKRTWAALVAVDVKPGESSTVNPRSRGRIPVAILGTADFDAATVDVSTIRFGATGVEAPPDKWKSQDINGDGRSDLFLHFRTQDTGLACGQTLARLSARTTDGEALEGLDAIKTTGCR
jgi:hypothetical protein